MGSLKEYFKHQSLLRFFDMLKGPTYTSLVKNFWVSSKVYDEEAAATKVREKLAEDPINS